VTELFYDICYYICEKISQLGEGKISCLRSHRRCNNAKIFDPFMIQILTYHVAWLGQAGFLVCSEIHTKTLKPPSLEMGLPSLLSFHF
jgi:hypothetical protein